MKFSLYPARMVFAVVTLAAVVVSPKPASAGSSTYRTVYRFQGGSDGWLPAGVPAVDKDGNLYGVTSMGGLGPDFGTVYKLTAPQSRGGKWTKTVLYDFPGAQGIGSPASLILGADGNLYGVVAAQTIFELSAPKARGGMWKYHVLYTLNGNSDGASIVGNLVFDTEGNLYGAAGYGGDLGCDNGNGCGTVFKLKRPAKQGGKWHFSVLHAFTEKPDGALPYAGLTSDKKGNLYSTTTRGGSYDEGAIYRVSPPTKEDGDWTESVLYSFDPGNNLGSIPEGPVTLEGSGNIYGTAAYGGDLNCNGGFGCGVVFELAPPMHTDGAWTYTTLYDFQGGDDGTEPEGYLVYDSKGNFYSTTSHGGQPHGGTAFLLSPPANGGEWTETVLHSFPENKEDGYGPISGLTWGKWGDLYGVALFGGYGDGGYCFDGCGTVFELQP